MGFFKKFFSPPTTVQKNPKDAVARILKSIGTVEKKQARILSLLIDQGFINRTVKLRFCKCGFPIMAIYSDRSSGPLWELLDTKTVGDDPYTHAHFCPLCKEYVTRTQS